jgi:hypothetical protein
MDVACSGCMPSLGLLHPLEFFVSVNHSALWQKHVSWAMRDGKDLRQYITSRYATNMVLLSLLLGAEISVFFNSSHELTELRNLLGTTSPPPYASIKFWIGLVLLLDICVTVMGLVATFTLWGMISAVSDGNAHCLLRSSLGEYVISLPPRLVVASLYLFLFWILMFVVEIVASPLSWLVVGMVVCIFFSIVIPLSAFGRLILHTGAMAQKPILAPELETQLLPSGLQASLLLRATHRQRRNQAVTAQYQRANRSRTNTRTIETGSYEDGEEEQEVSERQSSASHRSVGQTRVAAFDDEEALQPPNMQQSPPPPPRRRNHHRRLQSVDTVASDFPLPQASILNSTISGKELFDLMATTLPASNHKSTNTSVRMTNTNDHNTSNQEVPSSPSPTNNGIPPTHPNIGRGAGRHQHRRAPSSTRVLMEWTEDADVRDLYGASMPAGLPEEIDFDLHASFQDSFRWSPWNRQSRSLQSFSLDDAPVGPPGVAERDGGEVDAFDATATNHLAQPLLPHRTEAMEDCDSDSSLQGEGILSPRRTDHEPITQK